MAKLSSSAIETYEKNFDIFRKTKRMLVKLEWFKDHWFVDCGIYARGIGFQLSKIHWHNHEGQGVHLETWIDAETLGSKVMPIVMHVEPHVPNRREFIARFWALGKPKLDKMEGYTLKEENIMELFRKEIPFVKTKAAESLVQEFDELSALGAVIDKALKESK